MADVAEMKADAAEVKAHVAKVKADITKVKSDIAEIKANQVEIEIKAKLDLVLQILTQKEDEKEEQGASFATDEAATPLSAPNNQLVVYQCPHILNCDCVAI